MRSLFQKRDSGDVSLIALAKSISLFIILIFMITHMLVLSQGMNSGGFTQVISKEETNSGYFIELSFHKVRCSKDAYNLTEVGKYYDVTYYYNEVMPVLNKLKSIQLTDNENYNKND